MRQYRGLDDGVTTRLNRSMARFRDLGSSASPSLLSSSPLSTSGSGSGSGSRSSASASDLGTSTYAVAPREACAAFWRELVDVWRGREEVVRYCIGVVDEKARASQGIERALDGDFEARVGRGEDTEETLVGARCVRARVSEWDKVD